MVIYLYFFFKNRTVSFYVRVAASIIIMSNRRIHMNTSDWERSWWRIIDMIYRSSIFPDNKQLRIMQEATLCTACAHEAL